jgi:prepilin-type processing-associated H-X9-DG protein
MGVFAGLHRGGARWLGLVAAILASGLALPAAAAKSDSGRADLQLGPAGAGSDATGSVRFKHRERGDRVKLRLRDLEPRTRYDVRDSVTRSLLTSVKTNRHGNGKATLKAARLADGQAVGLGGLPIEICLAGTDESVLQGEVPGQGEGERYGCPTWEDFTYRYGTVSTDPEAAVQASITMSSVGGTDLEVPMDSFSLYVAPNWYVGDVDGDGAEPPSIPGPVTLWIADDEGVLQQVASLDSVACYGYYYYGVYPADGSNAAGDRHAGVANLVFADGQESDDGNDGQSDDDEVCYDLGYYYLYRDNMSDPGLFFGAATLDELVGREFEVRDGEDAVILSGVLPEMAEIVYEEPGEVSYGYAEVSTDPDASVQVSITMSSYADGWSEGTYESMTLFVGSPWDWMMGAVSDSGSDMTEIPGPVTLWIADADGTLALAATVEADDWGMPVPLDGMWLVNSCPSTGDGGDWSDWTPPQFYSWYADNQGADPLPQGVSKVAELSGRAFEVRDGEENVLLSGVLPELEELYVDIVYYDDPGNWGGDGGGNDVGDVSEWIDAAGILNW